MNEFTPEQLNRLTSEEALVGKLESMETKKTSRDPSLGGDVESDEDESESSIRTDDEE
jgi:hypothetical protein